LSSNPEIAFVDVLTGGTTPYRNFGALLADTVQRERELHDAASTVREQLREAFDVVLEDPQKIPGELDSIVNEMWKTGWNPKSDNINIFARDFGLILIESILALLSGAIIFRSESNDNHCSIFWSVSRIEAFPFHKTLKCLLEEDGNSMAYFVKGLTHHVNNTSA